MGRTLLTGVIEGFYGRPWTMAGRVALFDRLAALGLDAYFYAPKDDLHHRALWRDPYPATDADDLGELIRACRQRGLRFIYGISPGLDIRYSHGSEIDCLRARFEQVQRLGGEDFAILFDDIPARMAPGDLDRWGSLASAQCHVSNALCAFTRERHPHSRFVFCPTAYCGRMARAGLGGPDYLGIVGRELSPEIDIAWTGPEIISPEITVAHVRDLQQVLHRKPLIWDNLHANDYDGRRFFCGPYSGRPLALRGEVSGLLSNPNVELELNDVPLRTLAAFVHAEGAYDAREAYVSAMREWWPSFAVAGRRLTFEDLILFGDCYYLPHEDGPEARTFYDLARAMIGRDPAAWGDERALVRDRAVRLREFCTGVSDLRDRLLFHALSRRAFELREEVDLLERYLVSRAAHPDGAVRSDYHLPGTYRGGMLARLQGLLTQQPDGSFVPSTETDR